MATDGDCPGNDLVDLQPGHEVSPQECADICSASAHCRAFFYNAGEEGCYPKHKSCESKTGDETFRALYDRIPALGKRVCVH